MLTRLNKVIILSLLIMSLLIGSPDSDEAKERITIAILPCFDIVMSYKKFHPVIAYLEEKTGFDIKMAIQTDISEFELAIRNGDIDFALQDPHTYVNLASYYNKDYLLRTLTPEGLTTRRGVIIVRRDSGIHEVADLRGKTVMFGPKQSIAKWIAAKILLEENGINIDENLRAYSNGRCCEDIAFYVYLEAVDAGVVCSHFIEEYSDSKEGLGIDINEIVVIGRTDFVPTRVFAARKTLSNDIVEKFINALLSIDKADPVQSDILVSAELGGFEGVHDEDYDEIRELMGIKR
jgi:phosphonate transport system substrate-binding protein